MVATTVTVLRNGKEVKIPVNKVTLGDTVLLSSGTMIPADLRIIESKDLFVNQSSLTGESDSVKKNSISELSKEQLDTISDLDTICFMGTDVISGSGKGIVIKISDSTYFGKIADTLTLGKPKNAFQVEIENISKLLIKFMLIMIPIVLHLIYLNMEILLLLHLQLLLQLQSLLYFFLLYYLLVYLKVL